MPISMLPQHCGTDPRMAELDAILSRPQPKARPQRLRVPLSTPAVEARKIVGVATVVNAPATVYELWLARPCLICRELGRCAHREPEVDQAELDVAWRRRRAMYLLESGRTAQYERERAAEQPAGEWR